MAQNLPLAMYQVCVSHPFEDVVVVETFVHAQDAQAYCDDHNPDPDDVGLSEFPQGDDSHYYVKTIYPKTSYEKQNRLPGVGKFVKHIRSCRDAGTPLTEEQIEQLRPHYSLPDKGTYGDHLLQLELEA